MQDRGGGLELLSSIGKQFPPLAKLFADGTYAGHIFHDGLAAILPQLDIEIVKRNDDTKGFVVLPRRWVVEGVIPKVVGQFQTYLRELRVQDLRGSGGIYRLQMELLWRVNQAAAPTEVKDVLFQEILIQ